MIGCTARGMGYEQKKTAFPGGLPQETGILRQLFLRQQGSCSSRGMRSLRGKKRSLASGEREGNGGGPETKSRPEKYHIIIVTLII